MRSKHSALMFVDDGHPEAMDYASNYVAIGRPPVRPRPRLLRVVLLAALPLCLLLACGSGGRGGQPTAATAADVIGASGGRLEVTAGPLQGMVVEVPAGALDRPTALTVAVAMATAQPGFAPVSRAARLLPADTAFRMPVQITMPHQQASEAVLIGRDAAGVVRELGPTLLADGETITVAVPATGTFWVADRLFGGLPTAEFLPLQDEDYWQFDGGLRLSMAWSLDEANFDGQPVHRLRFVAGDAEFGLYLQPGLLGGVDQIGDFDRRGTGQQRLHDPLPLVPPQLTPDQARLSVARVRWHAPFGSPLPSQVGVMLREALGHHETEVVTPLGAFRDLLWLELRTTSMVGAPATDTMVLVLARNIGPVVAVWSGRRYELQSGSVGGSPIEP